MQMPSLPTPPSSTTGIPSEDSIETYSLTSLYEVDDAHSTSKAVDHLAREQNQNQEEESPLMQDKILQQLRQMNSTGYLPPPQVCTSQLTGYRNLDSDRGYWINGTNKYCEPKCLFVNDLCTHNTQSHLLYKIFHLNLAFKHLWHPSYLPVIVPMNEQTATHTHSC